MTFENEMRRSEIHKVNQEITKKICSEDKMKAIQDNVLDLFWEYDRMSSCGQKSLDALAKLTDVPTEREIQKRLKQYHKDTA